MIFPDRASCLVIAMLAGLSPAIHAEQNVGDVVTMRNGDIHIGRVMLDMLAINAAYGTLEIPVGHIQKLTMYPARSTTRITTVAGEQISGALKPEEIRVSRLQDPTLPLSLGDISSISFGNREQNEPEQALPSNLETVEGDRLRVKIRFQRLALQTEDGEQLYEASQFRYIDTSLHNFENELLSQFTLNDDSHARGKLAVESLQLYSPYQEFLNIPVEQLSRLTLDATIDSDPVAVFSHSMRSLGSGPQMVKIPGGTYLRGDLQGDGDDDEQPFSEIKLKPFAIGRFEISFEEYDLYCKQRTTCQMPDDQDWGRGTRPVINVSWKEALAYANWLAEKTGQPYRLPSDAEWEYAHRASSTSRFSWGNEVGSARANCEGCGSIWDGDKTAPVGRFEPNSFGLYDTAGNVFEWVADCFHDRFADGPADGSAIEKAGCGKRVIRGGAWSFPAHEIRSANRWRDFPSRRSDDTGFRVAMDLE